MKRKNLVRFFEQTAEKMTIWHVFLACLILAFFSVIYHQDRGFLHPELEVRLPYYLSNRPLLSKVFDSKILELDMYQARELSYVFDYIDSQFIALSIRFGFPHFLSLIHYVFMIWIGCVLWQFSVRELKLNAWIGLGLVMLLWTSPTVFLSGDLFRTAKIGAALTIAILYFYIHKILVADRQNTEYRLPASYWWICFTVSLMASLLDMQGFFALGLIIAFLLLWTLAFANINLYKLLGAFIASFALSLIHRFYAAPYLTFLLNHYWPNFSYQQLPWSELFSDQALLYWGSGPILYIESLRFLVGNIPEVVMGFLLIVPMVAVWVVHLKKPASEKAENKIFRVVFIGLFLTNVILMMAMYSLMVLRHPALFFIGVRLGGYYYLPATALFSMTLAFLISRIVKIQFVPMWAVFTLLVLAIIGNVIAIPRHEAILKDDPIAQPYFQFNLKLIIALKNINNPQYPIEPDVEKNPVYQIFRNNP